MPRLLAALPLLLACLSEPASGPAAVAPKVAEKQPIPAVSEKPVLVEVWHDTVCPWCRIGVANLTTALQSEGLGAVEVVYHPFLLDPETPPEGRDLRAWLGARYGGADVESMFGRVTQAGARYGVKFAWDQVRTGPKTDASHALIDWAPAEKKRALVAAVHDAYFMHGRNLGDPAELQAIATSVGLDGAAALAAVNDPARVAKVRSAALSASQSGISGVPYYVIGGRSLNGAQPPESLAAAIRAARSASTN